MHNHGWKQTLPSIYQSEPPLFSAFPPIADLEGVGEGRKQALLGSGDLKELNMKLICSVSQIIFN